MLPVDVKAPCGGALPASIMGLGIPPLSLVPLGELRLQPIATMVKSRMNTTVMVA
jgi:hypothetical protein